MSSNIQKFCALYKKQIGRGENGKTNFNALRGEVFSNIPEHLSAYHGAITIKDVIPEIQSGLYAGFRLCGNWEPPTHSLRLPKNGIHQPDELTAKESIYFAIEDAISQNDLFHLGDSEFVVVTLPGKVTTSDLREMISKQLKS